MSERIAIIYDHVVHKKPLIDMLHQYKVNYSTLRYILTAYYLFGRVECQRQRQRLDGNLPNDSQMFQKPSAQNHKFMHEANQEQMRVPDGQLNQINIDKVTEAEIIEDVKEDTKPEVAEEDGDAKMMDPFDQRMKNLMKREKPFIMKGP